MITEVDTHTHTQTQAYSTYTLAFHFSENMTHELQQPQRNCVSERIDTGSGSLSPLPADPHSHTSPPSTARAPCNIKKYT